VARAVVIIIIIIAAVAVAGVVAVDQEGVGSGKLLHTPALRTVGTGAGFSPKMCEGFKKKSSRGQEESLTEIYEY
jgi:hypothetical protein